MRQWIAGLRKRVGGLLADSPEQSAAAQRQEVVARGLQTISGSKPTAEQLNQVLAKQETIDALHHRLRDEHQEVDMEKLLSYDGLSNLQALKDKGTGYLFVFAQGFLGGILEQLTKSPKPIVSVVFKPHEDPTAHIPVVERGHGLAFELLFYPTEDPAMVTSWFDHLASVTMKPAAFAVSTATPVLPVWCRVSSENEITLEIAAPIQPGTDPSALTMQLTQHFAQRMKASPEEMDWEADCWYPPIKQVLSSRRVLPITLPDGHAPTPLKMLVRVPDSITEASLAVPAARALKFGRHDVHLTVLAAKESTAFWKQVEAVDKVLSLADTGAKGDSALSEPYDFGVVLTREEQAGTQLRRFAIHRLVGMENHPQSDRFDELLNMPRKLGPPEHRHRSYLRVAHRMGADVESNPQLRAPLREFEPERSGVPIVGLAPASGNGPSHEWPKERFLALVKGVEQSVAWRVFLSRRDVEGRKAWESELSKLGVAIEIWESEEKLSLDIAALQQCQLVVANDNEWLHLAAVCGVPTVAIYGPSDPIETAPVSSSAWTVRKHVECTPCFLAECPLDHRCMNAIDVADVMGPFEDLLERR